MIETVLFKIVYFKVQHRKRKMENSNDVSEDVLVGIAVPNRNSYNEPFSIEYSMRFVCDGLMYTKKFSEWNGFGGCSI